MTIENGFVDAETLKQHGFTDDELAGAITPETVETPNEQATETTIETPVVEEVKQEESAPDSVIVNEEEPHADNLKAALKEERERRKLLAAELAALKAQQQPTPVQQPQPQPIPQQTQDIATQIKDFAKQQAIKKLGIEGNPSELMFADPEKYEDYIAERAKVEYEEIAKYNQTQQVYNENVNFVRELQSIPDFPVVFKFAEQELDELPRKEAKKIDDAYSRIDAGKGTQADFTVIREFANQCQQKMKGINTAPTQQGAFSTPVSTPSASPLDKAAGLPRSQSLSGSKTSAMSWAQVEQLIREGKIDQIPKEMIRQIDPRLLE